MSTCCDTNTEVACTDTQSAESFTKPHFRTTQGESGYGLKVYFPGVGKAGVSLSLAKNILTVIGKRSDSVPESWKVLSEDLPKDDYRLRLHLDSKIDPDRITAKMENGVLEVALPVKEAERPRAIEVL